jgi:hypothetical protein
MSDLFDICCYIIELLDRGELYNNGNEVDELKKKFFMREIPNPAISINDIEHNELPLFAYRIEYSIIVNYYKKENIDKIRCIGVTTTFDKMKIFFKIANRYKLHMLHSKYIFSLKGLLLRIKKLGLFYKLPKNYTFVREKNSVIKNIDMILCVNKKENHIIFEVERSVKK